VTLYKATNPADRVDDEYIVVFKNDATDSDIVRYFSYLADENIISTGTFDINSEFKGVFVTLSTPEQLEYHLQLDSVIKYMEENQVVSIGQTCVDDSTGEWNLLRLSERLLDLGTADSYNYVDSAGEGVTAYIIDTGILLTHEDFEGRAEFGANFVDTNNADCNGHGTHVASTVAGAYYGVARKSTVVAVKVLNCGGSGTFAGVINGINWVTNNRRDPAVANMSLGGGYTQSVNDATAASVNSGVFHAVAAGNNNGDACSISPASTPEATTVGATTIVGSGTGEIQEDIRATFSNYGPCVDIFAPGQLITGAWIGGNNQYRTISGTSMASPHVAGAAALVLAENPTWGPFQVEQYLIDRSTKDIIDLACGNAVCQNTWNRMLFSSCAQ